MREYIHAVLYICFREKIDGEIGAGDMNKKNISGKTEYVMHGKGIDGRDLDVSFNTEWATFCTIGIVESDSGRKHRDIQIDRDEQGDLLRALKEDGETKLYSCSIKTHGDTVTIVGKDGTKVDVPKSELEKAVKSLRVKLLDDGTQTETPIVFGRGDDAMLMMLNNNGTVDIDSTSFVDTVYFRRNVEIRKMTRSQLLSLRDAIDFAIEHAIPDDILE